MKLAQLDAIGTNELLPEPLTVPGTDRNIGIKATRTYDAAEGLTTWRLDAAVARPKGTVYVIYCVRGDFTISNSERALNTTQVMRDALAVSRWKKGTKQLQQKLRSLMAEDEVPE